MKPWRGKYFGAGYSAEFLPNHQRTWRIVKKDGKAVVFPTEALAKDAAENAFLAYLDGKTRATLPVNPDRLEAKLSAEAEQWLRSGRGDVKGAETIHRAGKRPFRVQAGRA